MNEEYIEREVVIAALENTDWYTINKKGKIVLGASNGDSALFKANDMFALLRKAPTADVAPVVHGEWIPIVNYFHGKSDGRYYCSVCHRVEIMKSIYCRVCGARMDGGK